MLIDIHSHYYPRAYLDRLAERTEVPRVERRADGDHFVILENEEVVAGSTRPMGDEFFRLKKKLDFMDEHGIDRALISIGNPWVDCFDPVEAVEWATRLNDDVEKACAEEPRFNGLGVVALHDVEAACREAGRIAGARGLHGVMIGTRPGTTGHLDDRALDPFWAAAAEHELAVFVHPHYVVGADWLAGHGHAPFLALGFTFETTAAVTRLILGGVLERHPALRLVLAHTAGTLPFLAGRLEVCTKVDQASARLLTRPFGDYLRMMYCDGVGYHAPALRCAIDVMGSEHIMFGTDHPFGIADPAACIAAIRSAAPSERDAAAMLGANAVLNLLGSTPAP